MVFNGTPGASYKPQAAGSIPAARMPPRARAMVSALSEYSGKDFAAVPQRYGVTVAQQTLTLFV